jgi:hypothetical protein
VTGRDGVAVNWWFKKLGLGYEAMPTAARDSSQNRRSWGRKLGLSRNRGLSHEDKLEVSA